MHTPDLKTHPLVGTVPLIVIVVNQLFTLVVSTALPRLERAIAEGQLTGISFHSGCQ